MRKELTVYVATNEPEEEISVQRVANDPDFILLRLGSGRMVVHKNELLEAIQNIDFYSAAFDEEARMKENKAKLEASRAAAKVKLGVVETISVAPSKKPAVKKALKKEEEGTIVMDQDFSRGPTDSELALQKKMSKLLNSEEV